MKTILKSALLFGLVLVVSPPPAADGPCLIDVYSEIRDATTEPRHIIDSMDRAGVDYFPVTPNVCGSSRPF